MGGPKRSAGLLLFRRTDPTGLLEVMIVHMGGPFWAKRDRRAWSIPKGEYRDGEDPLAAARREFAEELGRDAPAGEAIDLGEVRQAGGKLTRAWALEADIDVSRIAANTFELEWPPRSGRIREFPEVDRAGWFIPDEARLKLVEAQAGLIDVLIEHLGAGRGARGSRMA